MNNTTPNSPSPQPINWFKNVPAESTQPIATIDKIALLAQADWLLLITQLLTPPSVDLLEKMAIDLAEIAELLDKSKLPNQKQLLTLFQAVYQAIPTENKDSLAEEYNRLFECSAPCPINECGLVRRDKGVILADIAGFYRAFGFELADNAREKADHLVVELEFVALLLVMLAKGSESANTLEVIQTTQNALSSFSFDHLGEWLPAFCERLSQLTVVPFYQHLAQLLQMTWSGIVVVNRLPVVADIVPEVIHESGTPYECGMA